MREMMEGVFLSTQVDILAKQIAGDKCITVGEPFRGGFSLVFSSGTLILSARPDAPSLWWEHSSAGQAPLPSPAWGHHLEGGAVSSVSQNGADRILVIRMTSGLMYGAGEVRLIFEAAGRNANIILVRDDDERILACLRKVLSDRCRYRSIAPGQIYVPPPPSGLPPGEWSTSKELMEALSVDAPQPGALYRLLEGVGPVTARAVLSQATIDGRTPLEVVCDLEKALLEHDFSPWIGPDGPLPIRLGPGEPIEDPMAPPGSVMIQSRGIREERLDEWIGQLKNSQTRVSRRAAHLERALQKLIPEEKLRLWASLLVASNLRTRGRDSIELEDWEGALHTIPLRKSRSPVENASRYFRKASNTAIEEKNLRNLLSRANKELSQVMMELSRAAELPLEDLEILLSESKRTERKKKEERGLPRPVLLRGGWRCFVGRSATDNDRITFTLGRRGDIWFHARGIPGAHVLLKLDGRMENPPLKVMLEAAALAARGSGAQRGVLPVDHTMVQHVRRMRKGKPGQVFYSREKTIFVDLDRLPPRQQDTETEGRTAEVK